MTIRRAIALLIAGIVLPLAACGEETSDLSASAVGAYETALTIPGQLEEFPLDVIDVADQPWLVAVAETRELRSQGLMGVTDLGSLDGMLFIFEQDTTASFHMQDTLISLDIAFFTEDGVLVSTRQMVPCMEAPCPSYTANGPYRYAVESAEGDLIDLPAASTLGLGSG